MTKDKKDENWGGMDDDYGGNLVMLGMIGAYTFLSYFMPFACEKHNCALTTAGLHLADQGSEGFLAFLQWPTREAYALWMGWIGLNLVLWYVVPGQYCEGDPTPSGHKTLFKCGALNSWFVMVFLWSLATYLGWLPLSFITERYADLNAAGVVVGIGFAILFLIKGYFFPTVAADSTKHSNFIQDWYLGLEIQPKLFGCNLKLFWIGRVGMLLWTVLGLSHAAYQYEQKGKVSYSMICTNFYSIVYTVDWAWKEEWYLRTIDMHHDRIGWMLAGGVIVAFPNIYACYLYYLAKVEVDISLARAIGATIFYCTWYCLFRLCNDEKDYVRNQWKQKVPDKDLKSILGRPVKIIPASYSTADGKKHKTILLSGGFWGVTRHFNYTCDLCMTFCYGLVCGFSHIYPHIYMFHMLHLLTTRIERDHRKCALKYGKFWETYEKRVPYKLLPGVY